MIQDFLKEANVYVTKYQRIGAEFIVDTENGLVISGYCGKDWILPKSNPHYKEYYNESGEPVGEFDEWLSGKGKDKDRFVDYEIDIAGSTEHVPATREDPEESRTQEELSIFPVDHKKGASWTVYGDGGWVFEFEKLNLEKNLASNFFDFIDDVVIPAYEKKH